MIIELLGTKIIAPYFGSSLYTWTSLIATTMISLSLGYHFGGRLSDKNLEHRKLYLIIFYSGVFLVIIPFLQYPILKLTSLLGLRLGSLTASMIFFALPLFLLGMVTPYSVKLAFNEESRLGATVGALYAISTIGSLFGTVVTGFFLIPNFGNIEILSGCSAMLFTFSGLFFLRVPAEKYKYICLILAVFSLVESRCVFSASIVRTNIGTWETVFRTNSNYGYLSVIDQFLYADRTKFKGQRGLFNDGLCQNFVDKASGLSTLAYTYAMTAITTLFTDSPSDVLCIGTGIGVIPMDFARRGVHVDAVEINPKMLEIAKKYFNFSHPNIKTYIEDGRFFLNKCKKKYDVVAMDAFLGESTPSHLLTSEMFKIISGHMTESGVLVINFFGGRSGDYYKPVHALYSTLKSVFPYAGAFAKNIPDITGVFFYASPAQPRTDVKMPFLPQVMIPEMQDIFTHPLTLFEDKDLILSDNYNPIEIWDIKTKERSREIIQKRNFSGLY